jgi:hypothetical protein
LVVSPVKLEQTSPSLQSSSDVQMSHSSPLLEHDPSKGNDMTTAASSHQRRVRFIRKTS